MKKLNYDDFWKVGAYAHQDRIPGFRWSFLSSEAGKPHASNKNGTGGVALENPANENLVSEALYAAFQRGLELDREAQEQEAQQKQDDYMKRCREAIKRSEEEAARREAKRREAGE